MLTQVDIGSHTEVQRTIDDDLTKSACVGYSFDKSCLGLCLLLTILLNLSNKIR